MKRVIYNLTEQRKSNSKGSASEKIQHAITAWLTAQLSAPHK